MTSGPIWQPILFQLILIFINAFFAATEIAVLSLNEGILRRQAEEGDKKSATLLKIVQKPTSFLSTIQIAITLAGFLASAFASMNFSSYLAGPLSKLFSFAGATPESMYGVSVVLVTLILSFLTLVLGELAPKRIAMQKSEQVARAAGGIISTLSTIMRPVIFLLSASTNAILRLLHIDPSATGEEVSEDEIRMMVDIGEEKGAIEASEKTMIDNIFEFNNMSAEEIMVHRTDMVLISTEDSDEEIVKTIEETGLSRFPVYDEDPDDIIGILYTRDYLLNSRRKNALPMRKILRPAYFVPESVRTDILFRDMQSKKVHLAVVLDEYGGTSGLVTLEDLLEEIVGNIYDEFDPQDEQEIVPLEDNLWRVSGQVELPVLSEAIDLEIPESEEYDTLGGLVFSQLSAIPEDGSKFEVTTCGLRIQVETIQDHRVESALVSKVPLSSLDDGN